METNAGIDYGLGQTNIDEVTGIRYGVIPQGEVLQAWSDESEPDYGSPTCPTCGNEVKEFERDEKGNLIEIEGMEEWEQEGSWDYYCQDCKAIFESESVFGEEPVSFNLDDGEYSASQEGDDTDIFILKSPFYTWCAFCSPCAPGAGYLMSVKAPGEGIKAYCFGHDWFNEGKAPYRVFNVVDNAEVLPG